MVLSVRNIVLAGLQRLIAVCVALLFLGCFVAGCEDGGTDVRCPQCGYVFRDDGNGSVECPQCGAVFDAASNRVSATTGGQVNSPVSISSGGSSGTVTTQPVSGSSEETSDDSTGGSSGTAPGGETW